MSVFSILLVLVFLTNLSESSFNDEDIEIDWSELIKTLLTILDNKTQMNRSERTHMIHCYSNNSLYCRATLNGFYA
jgi:thioredoxin-related protein